MKLSEVKHKSIYVIIVAGLFIELLVFNFRSLESLFISEREYPVAMLDVQDMEHYGEGVYQLTGEDETGVIYIWELDDLMGEVDIKNIYLDVELPQAVDSPYSISGIMNIEPFIRDEGHDRYCALAERIYRVDIVDSHYLWLQPAGKMKTLTLKLSLSEGNVIRIKGITINAKRAFSISPVRMLIIYLVLFSIYMMRGSSWIWKEDASTISQKKIIAAVAVGAGLLMPAVILDVANGNIWTPKSFQPYQRLAEAFALGQLSYLEVPPVEFTLLDNPYDYGARTEAGLQMDVDYLWDTSYYEGKYYCYFGVIPCVLCYLPVYLVSGNHLNDAVLIIILSAFIYAGLLILIREWIKRNADNISFAYLLMITAITFLGSGLPVVLSGPDAHDVPRVLGLAFVIWGTYLWISAKRIDKKGLFYGRLGAGSFLMALSVGCRPNQVLWSFLAVPLFEEYLKCDDDYGKGERTKGIIVLMAPYLPVAAGLMAYNYLRFGSVTDFGIAYNLTVLDYGQMNFSLDRLVVGIFEYLFRLPALTYHFPYITEQSFLQFNELGHANFYYTANFGGMITTNLLLWFLPVVFIGRKKDKPAIILIIIGMADMIFNSGLAGVAYHYRLDFSVLFFAGAAIGAYRMKEKLKGSIAERWVKSFLILAFVLSILYYSCFYINPSLKLGNTRLYYSLMHTVM